MALGPYPSRATTGKNGFKPCQHLLHGDEKLSAHARSAGVVAPPDSSEPQGSLSLLIQPSSSVG